MYFKNRLSFDYEGGSKMNKYLIKYSDINSNRWTVIHLNCYAFAMWNITFIQTDLTSERVNWCKIEATSPDHIVLQAATESVPPIDYVFTKHYLTFAAPNHIGQPVLTPAKSTASNILLTTINKECDQWQHS